MNPQLQLENLTLICQYEKEQWKKVGSERDIEDMSNTEPLWIIDFYKTLHWAKNNTTSFQVILEHSSR